jgi:leader peptidase (prepilin peptidase) / N-methyltransferase
MFNRYCAAPIAPFHLIVELAAVAMALWAAAVEPNGLLLWADCFLGWTLLALAWIDVLTMRLPDLLTLPLLVVDLLVEALLSPENLLAHIWGAAVGCLSFTIVAIGYRVLRGRDGLGGGDAKRLAVAGAWLGWAALPDVVFIAALLGIAGAIVSRARGHAIASTTALPFGPLRTIALWIVDRASVRTGDLRFSGRIISCGSGAGISFAVGAAKCRVFRDGAVRICEFA